MKIISFVLITAAALVGASVQAQQSVWRCGNDYTNNPTSAQQRECSVVKGGNVTVVQHSRVPPAASGASGAGAARTPASASRVESVDQRARDGEARSVLEAELRKAEARQSDLQKEFNNGEPDKQGGESRNYQKYLDRVAEMKAEMARTDSDVAGLRREIGRLPANR